jgi:hypothetical protein
MQTLSTILICFAGLINLLPMVGALSKNRIEALYDVTIEDGNYEILMRHRAVLLGIIGTLMIASAFDTTLRPAGYAAGFTAMLGYLLLAIIIPNHNTNIRRVATVDIIATIALLTAALIDYT